MMLLMMCVCACVSPVMRALAVFSVSLSLCAMKQKHERATLSEHFSSREIKQKSALEK